MSEINEEVEATEAPEVEAEATEAAPQEQASQWAPPKEEWERTQQALSYIVNHPMLAPPEEEIDSDDPYAASQRYIDQRLAQFAPSIQAATEVAGEKKLQTIFDGVEKETKQKFDRGLAKTLAQGYLSETGDPVAAAQQGAKVAAQIQSEYGKKAVEDYKKSLKRGPATDLPIEGAGEHLAPNADSYDEVISKWSAQSEV